MRASTVDRRVVLMSLGALGLLAGCSARKLPGGSMSFDEFVAELLPMADASVERGVGDQPRYLEALADLARRCGWPPVLAGTRQPLVEQHPVIITLLEVPAGESLPTHDHRGYCALMRVLSGRAIVRSYDEMATARRGNRLRLAPRPEQHLGPGDIAVAGQAQANIHGIDAMKDTLVVDVFTLYRPDPQSRLVEILAQSSDGTFEARFGPVL